MIKYGFFNSVGGDRKYNADDISNFFVKLISDGVFATPATCMQVTAGTGLNVSVAAGWGFIKCRWVCNTAPYSLTLDAADVLLPRIDRIVMRLDMTDRLIEIVVKKGTAASTPTAPALTRNDSVWELSLAQIAVAANATAISQADITDERNDSDVCGYVAGLIDQIDSTNLFAQFTAAFEEWFEEIKTEVQTTTLLVPYYDYRVLTGSTSAFSLAIPEYNPTLDILEIYVNGFKLRRGSWTYSSGIVTLTDTLDKGAEVECRVLKSMDTSAAETIVEALTAVQGRVTALEASAVQSATIRTIWKGTQAAYNEMQTHSADTLYICV